MKKILLIDDSDTYTWCLQKYLQHRGYPVKTACTLKEVRTAIQEEMPLVVCCDLDLPDGSGMDFLDEVRAADKELPFILASCHDKDDYEQEAMRRGATLCMDKMKGLLLQDKLVEYAYRQLSGEKAPTFHKLLFVYAEDTSAEVLRAAMLQKGFDLILVSSIWEAKRRIFEDKEIELILCDLELPDGTAMELFHTLRRVAGMFQMKNPPVRLLPFFILTENNDPATEYEYRHTSYNIVYLNALGISYTANSEDANDKGFSFMTVAGILVGSLILLAAGLVIYNILKISVSKRIKGYGTLRAIGSEKGQLYQIIVIEVTLLCLIGIPIGMLLGFLSARGILETATGLVSPELFLVQDSSELKTLIAENSSLNGTLLILSGAITLAFALFAALPAARSAARVSPIMAMSGTNLKIRRRKRKTKKIHNFEAYYARLNLKRNKGRTAITILSLVMSITVFIALQGFSSLLNAASALQDNHLGDYQITNESVGFTADDLNTLKKNKAVQSVAAIQFSLYEQNENGQLDGISLEFQLKPGETFQVVGLNDEYWDYFMGDQLPEEQLGQLKSGNACIVRNPIPMSYGEDVLEFTNIEAGENICVAGMELNVLKTLDGYDGYLGIGNGGFTNGVQVIVDDAIYERLTGKDTYSEFLPTLNEGADRENFDTFIEAFCNRIPGTTFLSYEETDQQLKESFAQIQMLAWGLILFVGLIGILNIINTVYTNIHTRVTEIGMQRAIGMSADSLYKTFLWEGAYYGIIASVIGSVLGYVCTIFIEAATSDTIQLVAIPVMPILEATLLAVGACLLATAIPLRKISKMNIVDSIETVE